MSKDKVVQKQQPTPDSFTITIITSMKDATVLVQGPIHRRAICIKSLVKAIDIILDQPEILKPPTANGVPPMQPQG